MRTLPLAVVVAGLGLGFFGSTNSAQAGHYGAYTYSVSRGYFYRTYSYYSTTTSSYRYHVAVYLPHQPRYVYYYNSHSRRYWGRYDLTTGKYQMLPREHQKATLSEIPETAFLAPGAMPKEGEGSDEALLPPPESINNNPTKPKPLATAQCR